MQRSSSLMCFLFGLILLSLQACQPADSPSVTPGSPTTTPAPASRVRIKSLSQDMPGNAARITAFTYDTQGRLSALLSYESPDSTVTWTEKSRYTYDTKNRLILHQFQRIARPNSIFGPISDQHEFVYNDAGQIAEIRYSNSSYVLPLSNQTVIDLAVLADKNTLGTIGYLNYNAANQVVGLKKVNYLRGQLTNLSVDYEYTYTGVNLTNARSIAYVNQSPTPYTQTEQNGLNYDDKINPFHGVYVIPKYFGGINDYFQNLHTLSANNILTIGGLTYRYEYNEARLPTVRYTYSDKLVETLRFTYETY